MTDVIQFITENWEAILTGITSLVGFFAVVATFTPTKTDDRIVQYALDFIHFLGANVGKAKNKEE